MDSGVSGGIARDRSTTVQRSRQGSKTAAGRKRSLRERADLDGENGVVAWVDTASPTPRLVDFMGGPPDEGHTKAGIECCMPIQYYAAMDPEGVRAPRIWIAACSHRLQRRWRTVAPEQLEEVAETLWADERLRALDPDIAADEWLRRGIPDHSH